MSENAKKFLVSWDMLQRDTRELAKRLLPASKWKGILAVSRGGLMPAAILARELDIRHVDTVCISSYDHDRQRELKVIKLAPGDGEGLIVIDDLVDTGNTAKKIRQLYPKAHFVVIYGKPTGIPLVDDYVVHVPQDSWIELPLDMTDFNYVEPICNQATPNKNI